MALEMPKVYKTQIGTETSLKDNGFPVAHYSASSMIKFSTNPLLFKIQYINKDRFDTTTNISAVVGKAFHHAMEVYSGGPREEAEAIEVGLRAGMEMLENYNDGYITFSDKIPNKQKAYDLFAFAFNSYVQHIPYEIEHVLAVEEEILEKIDVMWRGKQLTLPVKLKGFIDKVMRKDGKLMLKDYKTCGVFSNPEKIDGAKIIQAVVYYLLAYAKYGEEPYSLTFEEVKLTKNQDGSPQVREYEIVFAENELYFDFFFRFYEDMTRALNGEQVYVPNFSTIYDNEVGIASYIHRLDIEEEKANLLKQHNVSNITELLKKEIQSANNMKKLLKAIEKDFVTAKNLNYENMKTEEKIQTKLMEHGMMLTFDSLLEGNSVDLYRYTPTIGLKMSRLANYVPDIELVLGVTGVRILAPIPNSNMVGFEVPRAVRTFPTVPEGNGFDIAIGQNIMGEALRFDIRKAPHMLVAGASGKGKSVFLNALIEQLGRIPDIEMHLYDPKRVELKDHAKKPFVRDYKNEPVEIWKALCEIEKEMYSRYARLEALGKKNISEISEFKYKFVIIDEFGQLTGSDHTDVQMVETGKIFQRGLMAGMQEMKRVETNVSAEIENKILSLAQLARASGIHLIISTQSPRVDVIKGTIKANFPTKVLFKTSKAVDSTVVIDEKGGEKLLGDGDMLFASDNGIERLQGYLI